MLYALGFKITNGSSPIPRYKPHWVFLFQIKVSKYISTPNEPNIMQWMAKSMQALSEEIRRLAFSERGIYILIALQLHKSVVSTSNPNKNRFSSPLSWRTQACKWKKWKRKIYKEEEGVVPTRPSTPSSPKWVSSCLPLPKMISHRESRWNRFNFSISAQVSLSVVLAPLNTGFWRSAPKNRNHMGLSAGTEHPEMRINWRSVLENARRMAFNLDFWRSALNCYVHIFNFGFFSFFPLWLTTSLAWDKSFLSLNW